MKVELTPAFLDRLRGLALNCQPKIWKLNEHGEVVSNVHTVAEFAYDEDAQFIAAANPATVLAMVEEIERLRGLQCWVIMRKDNRDQVFDGPFFTEEDARLHVLDSFDHEYTVEPWVNQANVRESEAGQ